MINFDSSFNDKYKDLSVIGEGAAGIVYKALHVESNQIVAVKFLKNAATSDRETLMRFNQECIIARKLKHKNILGVINHGETGGCPYIVYEFIDGTTLQDLIGAHGALTTKRALKIIIALAQGIGFAHKHGIVHRDLKSENILMAKGGVIKIADFGVARAGASQIKTETGVILGTPAYMAPEQIQGYKVTPAADVYSLGIIFYELLTGSLPFIGSSPMETAMLHIRSEVPSLAPSIDEPFADVLDQLVRGRMLAKDVEDRWANGDAVVSSLAKFVTATGEPLDGAILSPQSDEALLPPKPETVNDQSRSKKVKHSLKSGRAEKVKAENEPPSDGGAKRSERKEKVDLPKTVEPVTSGKNNLLINIPFIGLLLLSMIICILHFMSSDMKAPIESDYSVYDLHLESNVNDATLTWVTTGVMTGSINMWESENKAESLRNIQEFANEGDGLKHSLKLTGLSAGMEYVYQFKDPYGNLSPERSFKTEEIEIIQSESRWVGPGKIKLEIEINIPLYIKTIVKSGNNRIFEERCTEKMLRKTFEVDMPLAEGALTWSVYLYSSSDKDQPVRFKTKIPIDGFDADMASDMEPFIKSVQKLKISSLLNKLKTVKEPPLAASEDLPVEALTLYASLDEILASYKDILLKRSEYIFSEPTIAASEKYRLFEILRDIHESLLFMESSGYKIRHSVEHLYSGDYARGKQTAVNSTRQIPLTFDSHYERFTSITLGREEGLVPTPIVIAGLDKAKEIELFLAVSGLNNDSLLQVRLNDYYVFNFYSDKSVGTVETSASAGTAGGTTDTSVAAGTADMVTRSYQKMDPRIFKRDTNVLSYKVLPVGRFRSPEAVTIDSAILRVTLIR